MRPLVRFLTVVGISFLLPAFATQLLAADESEVHEARTPDFNRDIRPLLSENCFHCHGFDAEQRQADLRLDVSGSVTDAVIERILSTDPDLVMPPPDSHRSLTESQRTLLVDWVKGGAPYDRHWAFAPIANHIAPVLESETHPELDRWQANPIDRFVRQELSKQGIAPMARVSAEKWLRRASLDLLGIGPTPAEVDLFIASVESEGESAYETAVDTLLESPRYGERMAQEWLDIARYADTHGFNNDSERSMWRWRDWVIDAYNSNLPYDQFVVKQLAGDLLPNATIEDHIATGFCRNHGINSEGGIIDEEYRVEYVVDRVRTLGTGILGLTLECARCHDHKFDPISQREFFSLYAFFNQVDEIGEDGRDKNAFPLMLAPTKSQQAELASINARIDAANAQLESIEKGLINDGSGPQIKIPESLRTERNLKSTMKPVSASLALSGSVRLSETLFGTAIQMQNGESLVEWELPSEANTPSQAWSFETWVLWDGEAMSLLSSQDLRPDPSSSGYGRGLGMEIEAQGRVGVMLGARLPAYVLNVRSEDSIGQNEWTHLHVSYNGSGNASGVMVYINGSLSSNHVLADGFNRRDGITNPLRVRLGSEHGSERRWSKSSIAAPRWYTSVISPDHWREQVDALRYQELARLLSHQETQSESIRREAISILLRSEGEAITSADYRQAWKDLEQAKLARHLLREQIATVMVMRERPELRETFVLHRGVYDAPREKVDADVPAALELPFPENAPRNRLGLARWLTDARNPLTARVAVNRMWSQFFGVGLVKTSEDFGYQGEFPSHPELLDWLSNSFVQSGWNVKQLQRQIVLSEAYRQESRVTQELLRIDPENRLLSRGPRSRLPAETLRDHLLGISGLLKHRLGGPSVYPLQPEDLYQGIVVDAPYDSTKWGVSEGDDLVRRSLYIFWKRTVPYPLLNVFDAPDREFCVARRSITNTPLQALVLMNEPTMLRAARGLGAQMEVAAGEASDSTASDEERAEREKVVGLRHGFRASTGRFPNSEEEAALLRTMQNLEAGFLSEPSDAVQLAMTEPLSAVAKLEGEVQEGGEEEMPIDASIIRKATWVAMASVLMNLDETITKN